MTAIMLQKLIILCFVHMISAIKITDLTTGNIHEEDYCIGNVIESACRENEVFVAHNATYGRMHTNKCITADMGYLGCGTNVLDILDRRCSGQQSCDMNVPNDGLNARNEATGCFKEYVMYLQASYSCEKVYPVPRGTCSKTIPITVSREGGFISSLASQQPNCGPTPIVWQLKAEPGQQINLTLVDFSWNKDPQLHRTCHKTYGYIVDTTTNEKRAICGERSRVRTLHLTRGEHAHTLRLVFNSMPDSDEPYNFLVHYKAVGCPDLMPPNHAWLTRDHETIVVGCHDTKQTWHLQCVGQNWQGVIGNCTQQLVAALKTSQQRHDFAIPHGLVIFLIITIAVAISALIIIVGVVILRRSRQTAVKRYAHPPHSRGELYEEPKYRTKHPIYDTQTNLGHPHQRNEYTHIWEHPLPDPNTPGGETGEETGIPRDLSVDSGMHSELPSSKELDHFRRYYALDKTSSQDDASVATSLIT